MGLFDAFDGIQIDADDEDGLGEPTIETDQLRVWVAEESDDLQERYEKSRDDPSVVTLEIGSVEPFETRAYKLPSLFFGGDASFKILATINCETSLIDVKVVGITYLGRQLISEENDVTEEVYRGMVDAVERSSVIAPLLGEPLIVTREEWKAVIDEAKRLHDDQE